MIAPTDICLVGAILLSQPHFRTGSRRKKTSLMPAICVFCGSRPGNNPGFLAAAEELGDWISANHWTLVYGGGSTGMMGQIADTVLDTGGQIIGVITTQLAQPDLMHHQVRDMRIVSNMHERKALMHQLADVYVTLPGALGTMEEFFEAATWAQLNIHSRPVAILNTDGVYNPLVKLLDSMVDADFLASGCRRRIEVFDTPGELTQWLQNLPVRDSPPPSSH